MTSNARSQEEASSSSKVSFTWGVKRGQGQRSTEPPSAETETPPDFPSFLAKIDVELDQLLSHDPILSDLAGQSHTASSLEAQLAFETGHAVRLLLRREDGSTLPILIRKSETVAALFIRVQEETERKLARSSNRSMKKINWTHVWRQNDLITEDKIRLSLEKDKSLRDLGLTTGTELRFAKKLREKTRRRAKQRRQSRVHDEQC